MLSKCKSCQADVIWVQRAKDAGTTRMPVDAAALDPTDEPHVYAVVHGSSGKWAYRWSDLAEKLALREAVSVQRARALVAERYPFHMSHFRTCPEASRHSGAGRRR